MIVHKPQAVILRFGLLFLGSFPLKTIFCLLITSVNQSTRCKIEVEEIVFTRLVPVWQFT